MSASESGERPESADRSPTEPESDLTPREVRRREREARRGERPQGMVPGRDRRRTKLERGSMRVVATGGESADDLARRRPPLRVRGLDRVRLDADLTILAKLACTPARARAVPLAG